MHARRFTKHVRISKEATKVGPKPTGSPVGLQVKDAVKLRINRLKTPKEILRKLVKFDVLAEEEDTSSGYLNIG